MTIPPVSVAIVDDHILYREMLITVVNSYPPYQVLFSAANGKELLAQLSISPSPSIIILDINMPELNGINTMLALRKKLPAIKVLALSGYSNAVNVAQMKQAGANGYLSKTATAAQVKEALDQVHRNGRYFPARVAATEEGKDELAQLLTTIPPISPKELIFLQHLCKGLSYPQIAVCMNLSTHTIHDYRDRLFNKLQAKNKSALIIQAIRLKLVDMS